MATVMTKQDLQGALDSTKNRIIDRLLSRNDVQIACDNARDRVLNSMNTIFQQHQQFMRQSITQSEQVARRAATVESRTASLEHELKSLKQIMFNMLDEQRHLSGAMNELHNLVSVSTSKRETAVKREALANVRLSREYGTA